MGSTMTQSIPFNKPFIVGQELYFIAQAVLKGQISGDGPYTKLCQQLIAERIGAHRVLLTTSCTAALEMAAILCDISEGDEVIVPSFAGASTANAFMLRGARPVFVDIRTDTMNLDETLVPLAVTERTRAIVPRHYAGVACDMDSIGRTADECGAQLIENAAEGVNATYNGRHLGTLAGLGTYSFHETKNIGCGEGGALIINDERHVERAEIVREKGTNRSQFFRGQVDKYTWVDIGSSLLSSDILAAFLYAQLQQVETISRKRERNFRRYEELLSPLAERGIVQLPTVSPGCRPSYHLFYLLCANRDARDGLIRHLREQGIAAVFHFVPLHTAPMGLRLGYRRGDLPVTEDIAGRLLRLPMYYELTELELQTVSDAVCDYFGVSTAGE